LVLLASFLVGETTASQCWTCYSEEAGGQVSNSACKASSPDPNKVQTENCPLGCALQEYTETRDKITYQAVYRSCLSKSHTEDLLDALGSNTKDQRGCVNLDSDVPTASGKANWCYKTCQTDKCNGGSISSASNLSLSIVSLFLTIYLYL